MARSDGLYTRGDIVWRLDDTQEYLVLAVFKETIWLRDPRTQEVIKGFPKERVSI